MADKDDFSVEMTAAGRAVKAIKDDFRQMKSDAVAIAQSLKSIAGIGVGGGGAGGFGGGVGAAGLGSGSGNILSGSQASFSTPTASFGGGGAGASMGGGTSSTGIGGASLGSVNFLDGALSKLPVVGSMIGNLGTIASGVSAAMPNVADTMQYSKGYYGASVMSGFRGTMGSRNMMQNATFSAISSRGGMTSAGADAAVASLLTSRGMQFSANSGSTYMQTVNSAATMAKYLNMPVEDAASSIEGLTSGSGASSLLRNFGIFASDTATGKEKTMPEIFAEIRGRLALGDTTQEGTMKSLRSGSLNVVSKELEGMFGAGTADMFSQYMLDASGDGTQAMKWTTGEGLGDENPLNSIYDLNASTTKQYGKAEEQYIQGLKDAVPIITSLNDAFGDLAASVGNINSFFQLLGGSSSVTGTVTAAEGVAGLIPNAINLVKGIFGGGGDTSAMGTNFAAANTGGGGTGYQGSTANTGGETTSGSVASAAGTSGGSSSTKVFRLVRPVTGRITLGYNVKDVNHKNGHTGIDFAVAEGTPVQAGADGTVVTATKSGAPNGGYGMYMEVDHGNGFKTLYAHLSGFIASVGSTVKAGQAIGKSGNTGFSKGPHLHFTLFKNGGHVDPSPYLGGSVAVSGSQSSTSSSDGSSGTTETYIGASDLITTGVSGIVSPNQNSAGAVSSSSGKASSSGVQGIEGGAWAMASGASYSETGGSTESVGASIGTAGSMDMDVSSIATGRNGSRGSGAGVVINLTVAKASDEEARRFASLVKRYIKEDSNLEKMGRM